MKEETKENLKERENLK